jgi:hypothetical protein
MREVVEVFVFKIEIDTDELIVVDVLDEFAKNRGLAHVGTADKGQILTVTFFQAEDALLQDFQNGLSSKEVIVEINRVHGK